jgi:hypothetical protein
MSRPVSVTRPLALDMRGLCDKKGEKHALRYGFTHRAKALSL